MENKEVFVATNDSYRDYFYTSTQKSKTDPRQTFSRLEVRKTVASGAKTSLFDKAT